MTTLRAAPLLAALFAFAPGCGGVEEVDPLASPAPEASRGPAASPEPARAPVDPQRVRAELAELEARAERQQAELSEAKRALEAAGAELAAKEQALERTRAELAEARGRLAAALPAPPRRSDAEIFRAVQLRLLEDEALARVAIAASVEDGTVVLRGRVPDAATRDAALAIARAAAAPAPVRSEIETPDRAD